MFPTENRGFTLLEILAAIAILAVVLTALFGLHLQTLSMGAETRFYTTAPLLAQEKIAQIQTEGLDQVRSDSGDFGDDFPRYRWEASVSETDSAEFESEAKMLRRVDIHIVDKASEAVYRLRAYRYVE